MNSIIYYRRSLMEEEELSAAKQYFSTVSLLTDISENSFVIPRYSLYPYPLDQEKEILNLNSNLINSYNQHRYVADLQNYVYDLKELTPLTWSNLQDIPEGQFVLKGETNSRKSNWNRDMFASSKQEAIQIYGRLCDDSLIGQQKIYIRQYVPLVTYFTGIGGIPVTEEFRFFTAYGKILCGAYYWQNYVDDLPSVPDPSIVPMNFLNKVLNIIGNKINFVVIDVAKTLSGEWIVVELNDGCQSGLSCNDPKDLYCNLKEAINVRFNNSET